MTDSKNKFPFYKPTKYSNNPQEYDVIKQYTELANEIGDLIFELEKYLIINDIQAQLISEKLDAIFKKHIEKALHEI